MASGDALVSMRELGKRFTTRVPTGKGTRRTSVVAVADVNLDIAAGETLGLVGESGCGKTTLGRLLCLFHPPSSGELHIRGVDVTQLGRSELKAMRRHVQMIFQDPMSSLNPRHTIATILTEPLQIFREGNAGQRRDRAAQLLEAVGMSAADLARYPHEFSGGQRQRITIARALVLNPAFIVADEPVSALDVSVQSQILNLLKDVREQFSLTYLFISHDMAVVHHLADRVAVMYLGRIVEIAARDQLFAGARHPYTQSLLRSVPTVTPGKRRIGRILPGDPPSPINPPTGCTFHPRCAFATELCRRTAPALEAVTGASRHAVACHHSELTLSRTGDAA